MKQNALKFISMVLAYSITGSTTNAKVFDFTCGNIEFTIDFEKSTASDTIDGTASVDWQYDGDWVRWNVKDTDEFFGVNVKTGDLILDGVVNQAGCRMGDTAVLESLPLSEGAYLRHAFIDLPEQKRKEVQAYLSQVGYYSSDIDGKWGRGTEAAIKTYVSENQEELAAADYSSSESARNTLYGAISHTNLDSFCTECDTSNEALPIDQADDSQIIDTTISDSTLRELMSSIFSCWNAGSLSSSAFSPDNRIKMRFTSAGGNFDPQSFEVIESNSDEATTRQIAESLRRAVMRCGLNTTDSGFFDIANRTYELTYADQSFSLQAFATKSEVQRILRERTERLEAERKAAEAKRTAELAEEKRKHDAEIAAKQAAAEAAAAERASATPEKIDELKQKCASSVTVSGLCWALSHEEMRLVLIGRGYACGDGMDGGFLNAGTAVAGVLYGLAGEKMSVCEKGAASVLIEPLNLTFSCDVFNTCSYNVRDLGRLLIDEGLASSLEPSVQVVEGVALTSYCGRGNDGTEICASNSYDMFGQERNVVSLRKGTAGGSGPTFD